ncbi:acyl-CoA dehydrogenase family protein [Halioxenophilus sp. WMMB6]|uniref:acyl-CoA dehydrogenase family protein n=1 Tax=Halioxenophilus sp. WMMB6 TaxID=3073815 RepID=UPI00295E2465|nr:acyl-CoA dehydrogenase family protein [Halioxenophilus sp. WMMB6]
MNEFLKELQDSARQVMTDAGTPAKEESTWPLVVELGWLLTAVPEEQDGLGLGLEGLCTLHSELGRNLAEVPYLPATLSIDALCYSQLADKADWVGRFTMGELATTSLVDPNLTATKAGDSWRFDGSLSAVQSADNASHLLVWSSDGQCVALVAMAADGVEATARSTWDTTRRLFDVTLTGATAEAVLAEGEAAQALVARITNGRDFGLAADALGGAEALLALTIEHLQTRVQFGRPLALFQALKHRCADLKTEIAAATALLNDTLTAVADDLGSRDAVYRGKKVKYLAASTYAMVVEDSLQLHGGIGMASEYPCHLYLKRSMLSDHLGTGSGEYQTEIADTFLANLAG